MRILAMETSCDETAVAVVEDGTRVLANVIASSKDIFRGKTGVIPEEAARKQVECMLPVLEECLCEALSSKENIDALAVTHGPGLLGSLLVGTTTARTLAALWEKPLIPVHHIFGHLSSVWLGSENDPPLFPAIALTASGGHTDLWFRRSHTKGTLLGSTRDDAAGEAFDKGASILGLPYPGGPAISNAGEEGDPLAFKFPLPLRDDPSLDFSFSGLKTALKYTLRDLPETERPFRLHDLAASYEQAICSHLVDRIERALRRHPDVREIHLVGGVSANRRLRLMLKEFRNQKPALRTPQKIAYCTDNAAMIAGAAYFLWKELGESAAKPFMTEASLPIIWHQG